jgi:hypothetical protein
MLRHKIFQETILPEKRERCEQAHSINFENVANFHISHLRT